MPVKWKVNKTFVRLALPNGFCYITTFRTSLVHLMDTTEPVPSFGTVTTSQDAKNGSREDAASRLHYFFLCLYPCVTIWQLPWKIYCTFFLPIIFSPLFHYLELWVPDNISSMVGNSPCEFRWDNTEKVIFFCLLPRKVPNSPLSAALSSAFQTLKGH